MTSWCRPRISSRRQIKRAFSKTRQIELPISSTPWDELAKRLAVYDPATSNAVNYMWGTTGIGFDVKKASAVLGPGATINSWDIVFKPEQIEKFKNCGVEMLDSSTTCSRRR